MQFTPLEAMLLSGAGALIGGLIVRLIIGGKYVTKSECRRSHHYESQTNDEVVKKIDGLQDQIQISQRDTGHQLNILFRMMRRFIVNSNLDSETQERILNDDQRYHADRQN